MKEESPINPGLYIDGWTQPDLGGDDFVRGFHLPRRPTENVPKDTVPPILPTETVIVSNVE